MGRALKSQETEEAYGNDWNLLELFFNNCGKRCALWSGSFSLRL